MRTHTHTHDCSVLTSGILPGSGGLEIPLSTAHCQIGATMGVPELEGPRSFAEVLRKNTGERRAAWQQERQGGDQFFLAAGLRKAAAIGMGDDAVGNPCRAQIFQFEFFEFFLLLELDKRFSIEQFEPTVSQPTVSSPPLALAPRERAPRGETLAARPPVDSPRARAIGRRKGARFIWGFETLISPTIISPSINGQFSRFRFTTFQIGSGRPCPGTRYRPMSPGALM